MPPLVNRSGDDSPNLGPFSFLRFLDEMCCSPRKHPRVDLPYASKGDIYGNVKRPSIEFLPDECLFEILKRVCGARERSISACVSKRWLRLLSSMRKSDISKGHPGQLVEGKIEKACTDVNMTSLDENLEGCDGYLERSLEGKKATDIRLAAIAVGTASRGGLGRLSIRGSNSVRGVTNFGLSAIGHGCPSLRDLFLWNIPTIGDDGLLEIARGCHSLEKLDLCQCPALTDNGLIAIAEKCPNLTALTLESCSRIRNKGLQAVGRHCPKIQSIVIKNCSLVGDEGVAGLLSSASTVLKTVKLQLLNVTDLSLALIGHYGLGITDLVLGGLQKVSQRGFLIMAEGKALQQLASLTLASCNGATDLSLEAVGKGCPNLRQMCLRKCCFVSDDGLAAFAKAARSLENIEVEECNRITQRGLLSALSHCISKLKSLSVVKCLGIKDAPLEFEVLSPCQSLRSLTIRCCPGFTSNSLAMVGKLCPQLRHLDLSGLTEITDEALMPLLETCQAGLVKVNLSNCVNLTDEAISALARLHGRTLELLNLEECRKVTDASLVAIAYYCFVINDLDVSNCSISDAGVAALCDEVHSNFQILSLSGCSMVSEKSVPYLKMLSETLIALNIRNCNSLSSSAVEHLIEELWRCDIFS